MAIVDKYKKIASEQKLNGVTNNPSQVNTSLLNTKNNTSGITSVDVTGNTGVVKGQIVPTPAQTSAPTTTAGSTQGATPTTPTANSSITGDTTLDQYKQQASALEQEKSGLDTTSTTYQAESDALNQKIASANTLVQQYLSNAQAQQSSKAQAYMAQQNAQNSMQQYMNAAGLGGQGVAESTLAQANQNYATQQNAINTSTASDNNSMYENYLNQANEIEQSKQAAIAETQAANAEYGMTNISSATDVDDLDKYYQQVEAQYQNGEISQADYNNIKNLYDTQYTQLALTGLGVSANTAPVNIKSDAASWKGENGTQVAVVEKLVNCSPEELEQLGITDGTAVDINVGNGKNVYVYLKGKWYKRDSNKKGGGVVDIDDITSKILGSTFNITGE